MASTHSAQDFMEAIFDGVYSLYALTFCRCTDVLTIRGGWHGLLRAQLIFYKYIQYMQAILFSLKDNKIATTRSERAHDEVRARTDKVRERTDDIPVWISPRTRNTTMTC